MCNYGERIKQIMTFTVSVFIGIFSMANASYSKDLGQYGHVFSIVEVNMLDWIYARLNHMKASGELKRLEDQAIVEVKKHIRRPKPTNLGVTTKPRTFYKTPEFVLQADIKDSFGRVLYPKGLSFNPLDASTYPESVKAYHPKAPDYKVIWLFFNGDDNREVNFIQKELIQLDKANKPYKLILTGGDIKVVSHYLKRRVYFDLYGYFSRYFNLIYVPSIVQKDGVRFKIQEFDVSNESSKLKDEANA